MIKKPEKKAIKAALGKQYSPKIIAHLTEKGLFNEKGEPYSPASIQRIVNGRENLTIEAEIATLVATAQQQRDDLREKKSALLKAK